MGSAEPAMAAAADDTGLSRHGTITCMTRSGVLKTFDTSLESVLPFGFRANDRVQTPRGPARVLGVWEGHLYFVIDGDHGASTWTALKTSGEFSALGFYLLSASAVSDGQDDSALGWDVKDDEHDVDSLKDDESDEEDSSDTSAVDMGTRCFQWLFSVHSVTERHGA